MHSPFVERAFRTRVRPIMARARPNGEELGMRLGFHRSRVWGRSLLVLGSVAAAAWGGGMEPGDGPPVWKRVNVAGVLSLELPPEVARVDMVATDSLARRFRGPGLDVLLDYGRYSNPLVGAPGEDRRRTPTEVGGRAAALVEWPSGDPALPYASGLHLPEAGGDGLRLTVVVRSAERPDASGALRILRSVEIARTGD